MLQDQKPWEKYAAPSGQTAPSAPPAYIPGPPKQVDPAEQQRLQMEQTRLGLSQQSNAREQGAQDRANRQQQLGGADQLRNDFNQRPEVKSYLVALPVAVDALKTANTPAGDMNLIYAYAKVMDPNSVVREGEQAAVSGGDTVAGQLVARLRKELQGDGAFRPEYRQQLRTEIQRRVADMNRAYIGARVDYKRRAEAAGVDPFLVVGDHPGARFQKDEEAFTGRPTPQLDYMGNPVAQPQDAQQPSEPPQPEGPRSIPGADLQRADQQPETYGPRLSAEQEDELRRNIKYMSPESLTAWFKDRGLNVNNAQQIYDYYHKGGNSFGGVAYDEEAYKRHLRERNAQSDELSGGRNDYGTLAAQGATLGGSDEIAGASSAIGSLLSGKSPIAGYTEGRDAERLRIEEARKNTGKLGTAAEIAGGLVAPIPLMGDLKAATTAGRVAAGVKGGALAGSVAGFNYGEGGNSVPNALAGALTGAAIGGGVNALAPIVSKGAGKLFNSQAAQADRAARAAEMAQASDVAAAAQAEGVPVSRGVLDPRTRNQVTSLETTQGGNAPIHRGLETTRNALESGVDRLGSGGAVRDTAGAGEVVQNAGMRFIERSRNVANRLYDRAQKLGGNTKITPQQAIAQVDAEIADLSQNKSTNQPLINYMEELKADLSRNGVTVDSLRNLRSQMRGQINNRNLTATDAERRVMGVLDAASGDIQNGLQGNTAALAAYQRADKFWRDKQTYINDVVQKFIGRRDTPMSPEQTFAKFRNMAKPTGDSHRLAEMMRSLEPQEASDIAATFADMLGRNTAGDFTAAQLVSQAEKLSDRAKETIFGPKGKQSLDNLVKVARELKATEGNLNHSRTAVANNYSGGYRGWLAGTLGFVGGGAAGLLNGGASAGAMGATAGALALKGITGAAKQTSDALSARALMSPEISKWLASAPRSVNPQEIDRHLRQLGQIAAKNPALANEVTVIQQRVTDAIRSLPDRAAASGPNANQDVNDRRKAVP